MAITGAERRAGGAVTVFLPPVRQLEALGFRARPADAVVFDGTWMMRHTPGLPARRLNSVNPVDPRDVSRIDRRIVAAEQRYRNLGIRPVFRLSPLAPPLLDDQLDLMGWEATGHSLVMQADLSTLALDDNVQLMPARDATRFVASMLAIQQADAGMAEPSERLLRACQAEVGLFLIEEAGEPIATAICIRDGRFAGLFDIATLASARGRGLGRRVVQSALNWARLRGARFGWLQVEADNGPALALYRSLGFADIYPYHYRIAPK